MLESEEQKAQTMQDELLKKVSSLVVNFTNHRNRSLRDAGLSVREAMKEGIDGMEACSAEHSKQMDAMLDSSQATAHEVVKKGDAGRGGAEEVERALGVVAGEVRTGLTNYQHAISGALNEQITRFGRQQEEMDVKISGGLSCLPLFKKTTAHIDFPFDRVRENWQEQTSSIWAYRIIGYRIIGRVPHTTKWIVLCI
jgi:hypothetical protein